MKRQLSGAALALLIASGALVSACNVTPPAATANGTDISTASLNSQLRTLESTQYGGCLLQLENPQLSATSAQGAGGPGTYTTAFAGAVLESQVGQLLAEQFAMSKGITVSSSDLATAKTDFQSTLDGEISAAVQQATVGGSTSFCESPTGASFSGKELLANLPQSVTQAQIRNQAFDEELLADGADLSNTAIFRYYVANKDRVHGRLREPDRDQVPGRRRSGGDPDQWRCLIRRRGQVELDRCPDGSPRRGTGLLVHPGRRGTGPSAADGRRWAVPSRPGQNSGTGEWFVYEVTSQSLEPLSAARPVVRRELLQGTANVDRVSREIIAFAHRSDVSVESAIWDVEPA